MAERKQAIVVGALGVIGRYIVTRLLEQGDWSVVGLSRRTAETGLRYHHIAVDLLDAEDAAAKLAGLGEARTFSTRVSARGRRCRGLRIEHRVEPRHARQRCHGDRSGVGRAAAHIGQPHVGQAGRCIVDCGRFPIIVCH
jgi:NAD(P)-dependent dehydrogenase (short-subunit alcohol dehydrogenase family)